MHCAYRSTPVSFCLSGGSGYAGLFRNSSDLACNYALCITFVYCMQIYLDDPVVVDALAGGLAGACSRTAFAACTAPCCLSCSVETIAAWMHPLQCQMDNKCTPQVRSPTHFHHTCSRLKHALSRAAPASLCQHVIHKQETLVARCTL